jgi:O-antigen ligase
MAVALLCVFLSRSSTSLITTLFVTFFMLLLLYSPPYLRRYMPYLIGSFAVLVLTYAVTVLDLVEGTGVILQPIFALTGKDATFTNRSEIWNIIKDQIALSPLLGCGYGAYWNGADLSAPSYIFMVKMYFYPAESHNGYLEITNDLGFLGLMLLLYFLVVYVRQCITLMKIDRAQGALYLALFFQQAIMNLSESTWLQINSPNMFMIMTLATFAIARALQERQAALQHMAPGAASLYARPRRY